MQKQKVVAVLDDLMFLVKIDAAARQAGFEISFVKTEEKLFESVKDRPSLILLDLNFSSLPVLDIIRKLKSSPETQPIPLIAYISHVQVEFRKKAEESGADQVLARSVLSSKLPVILQQFATDSSPHHS